MKIFLTSDIGASEKINGKRFAIQMSDKNCFLSNLKKELTKTNKFVFVASDPTAKAQTKQYFDATVKSFKMSGLEFNHNVVVDDVAMDIASALRDADLVFLAGGYTPGQNKFFKKINLSKHLKDFSGVIVGQSAGTMNLAKKVYSNDAENGDQIYFDGLGLSPFTIDPHFKLNDETYIKRLLADSVHLPFIALPDGSYILIKNNERKIFGDAFLFENGKMSKICQDEASCEIQSK